MRAMNGVMHSLSLSLTHTHTHTHSHTHTHTHTRTHTGLLLPIRLAGGDNDSSGRVEVYHNGTWGSICDDYWDIRDARVVCRELGFLDAYSAPAFAHFGEGEGEGGVCVRAPSLAPGSSPRLFPRAYGAPSLAPRLFPRVYGHLASLPGSSPTQRNFLKRGGLLSWLVRKKEGLSEYQF